MTAVTDELPRRDAAPAGTERLGSLDAFRGATIAAMILVNNAGDWDKTMAPLLKTLAFRKRILYSSV